MSLVFLVFLGFAAVGATVDVPFELGRPARSWSLLGTDIAFVDSSANPAALGFFGTWNFSSTYASPFGVVQVWAACLGGPGFSGEAVLVDGGEIGPGLRFRVLAAQTGLGWRWGALGLGGRARLLRPIQPKEGLGWALDVGLRYEGAVQLGILAEALVSKPPNPQEFWPTEISLAMAVPLDLWGASGTLAAAVLDVPVLPSWAVAAEVKLAAFHLILGFGPRGGTLGGRVKLSWFALEWAFALHPDLPPSFRVSFVVAWS